MSLDQKLKLELIPGVLKIDPGRCFLHMIVHGGSERLRCAVLPISSKTIANSDGSHYQEPVQSIVAFRSKAWAAFSILGDNTPGHQEASHLHGLVERILDAPRGFLECVEPTGWSKIEVVHPGCYAYPGKGFHLTINRDDLHIESVMKVIWPQKHGVIDEQHFVLQPHASSLGAWIAKIFRRHDQSLSTRYQCSSDNFGTVGGVVCNDGRSDSDWGL